MTFLDMIMQPTKHITIGAMDLHAGDIMYDPNGNLYVTMVIRTYHPVPKVEFTLSNLQNFDDTTKNYTLYEDEFVTVIRPA